MKEDGLSKWIRITIWQICKENNLDIKDFTKHKFLIWEELQKRFEKIIEKYPNDPNMKNYVEISDLRNEKER